MGKDSLANTGVLAGWYWLSSVKGLGPAYTRILLDALGDPRRVLEASRRQLEQSVKLPGRTWEALEYSKQFAPRYQEFAEHQVRAAQAMGARILTLHDSDYPEFLRAQRTQAPPVLHVQGNLDLIRPRAVAVVGTRSPSPEALGRVNLLAKRLCESGCPVVAGMARGIDTAAHRGALESCGMTVGVLGSGLDRVYPPENTPLFAETRKRGLLVSQFPFGSAPSPDNLRQRNKLIAALVDALIVAESGIPGGALIAARAALEQGKNLFVLSWQADTPSRAGNSRLLEAGLARPVEEDDVESLFEQSLFCGPRAGLEKAWRTTFPPSVGARGSTPRNGARKGERPKPSRTSPSMKRSSRPNRSEGAAEAISNSEGVGLQSLREGDRVTHATHGQGSVVELEDGVDGERIIVAFRKDGLRLSLPLAAAKTQLTRG